MTQQPLNFGTPKRTRRPSLTDQLERHVREHWGQWIFVTEMAQLVGTSGVRQRRLEVEKRLGKPERQQWVDSNGRTHLMFRWPGAHDGRAA